MAFQSDSFDGADLVRLNDEDYVILASGGPLLKIICIEGDNALCEWPVDGKRRQKLFPAGALRRLTRLDQSGFR